MARVRTIDQIQQDSLAIRYDSLITPRSNEWGRNGLRHVDIGPGRSLLDIGAGSGAFSIPAAMTGTDVTASTSPPP
ncbi:MAG TPA: hypothetical protein VE569_02420 [Acidimicrobiia bacterium]|nr:hypothetical protein [Acidimicrobiia bacterium]